MKNRKFDDLWIINQVEIIKRLTNYKSQLQEFNTTQTIERVLNWEKYNINDID